MNPKALKTWNALQFTCSVFWTGNTQRRPDHFFRNIFGNDPQTQSKNIAQQLFQEQGQLSTNSAIGIRLGMNPSRADAVFLLTPTVGQAATGLNACELCEAIAPSIEAFFAFHENVSRVAYAAVLLRPAEVNKSALDQARETLPQLSQNLREALTVEYKLERCHSYPISGKELKVNTITNWSLANFLPVIVSAGQPVVLPNIAASYSRENSQLALEIEVNTDAERTTPLSATELTDVLNTVYGALELVASAPTFDPK